jgi:DNA-directed RNA polymerase specialized sigma24 family protein
VAQQDVLDRALRSLELENRSLVIMHFYLGLSVPEAASILGIPLGTAKSRLSRSLAQMRLVAVSDGGEEPVPRTILPARQEGRPA